LIKQLDSWVIKESILHCSFHLKYFGSFAAVAFGGILISVMTGSGGVVVWRGMVVAMDDARK
jgi:hypothetical protein